MGGRGRAPSAHHPPESLARCRALGHRGGSGLLVDEELARAITHESAAALMYWWGITGSTAARWRTALGVLGLTGTEGTRRLVQAGQVRRLAKLRAKKRFQNPRLQG
jgi:hypothetical protein